MGLLDDAIREHLELKRRRGADPGEVAREQREALAPVERERASHDDAVEALDSGAAPAGEPFATAEAGAPYGDAATGAPEDLPAAPPAAEDAVEPGIAGETAELDMRTVLGDEDPPADGSATPGVAGGLRPASGADAPLEDDVLAEGDPLEWEMSASTHADDEAELSEDRSAEDVLEETPDFLRDTPEQDRLWFEQRPPRDFDFDK